MRIQILVNHSSWFIIEEVNNFGNLIQAHFLVAYVKDQNEVPQHGRLI